MRNLLRRGQGRVFLSAAYRRHGFQGCPWIQRPSNTRMISYARAYLLQSFTHYAVRYDALMEMQRALRTRADKATGSGKTRLRKRAEEV